MSQPTEAATGHEGMRRVNSTGVWHKESCSLFWIPDNDGYTGDYGCYGCNCGADKKEVNDGN
jgi:hypothetical protein